MSEWYLGLMTGTVLDGQIDIALIRTDGTSLHALGAAEMAAYPPEITPLLRECLDAALKWGFDGPEPAIFARAEKALTRAQAEAVLSFLGRHQMQPEQIRAIGFHGQSVLHRAPKPNCLGRTRQLGDGPLMARLTGIDTVFDFRSADMAQGGNGAPLAPAYHAALLEHIGAGPDTALLNLGGVGNISWQGRDGALIGFDTGPANAPINDFVRLRERGDFDQNGALARQGHVDEARLRRALQHPYFETPPPKSLDRFDFTHHWVSDLSDADGAATLTAFSAAAVAASLAHLPQTISRLVVCGGGRHNSTLLEQIAHRSGCETLPADALELRGDTIEAECFGYLAARHVRRLPISWPSTTGVPAAMTGGQLALSAPQRG